MVNQYFKNFLSGYGEESLVCTLECKSYFKLSLHLLSVCMCINLGSRNERGSEKSKHNKMPSRRLEG